MKHLLSWTLGLLVGLAVVLLARGQFRIEVSITHKLDLGELVKKVER